MGQTVASIHAPTDKQDIQNQRLQILDYTSTNKLPIKFIEITISSRKDTKQRRIDELLD